MTTQAVGGVGKSKASHPLNEPTVAVKNPKADLDRDAFLKLLVAQLKYQDPTQPADTSQMLAQSAQLTMVDRMNEMATAITKQVTTQRMSLAGNLVGRHISFLDEDGQMQTARVDTAKVEKDTITLVAGGFSVPYDAIASVHAGPVAPNQTQSAAQADNTDGSSNTDNSSSDSSSTGDTNTAA